jgi:hypothetical protein
LHKRRLTSSCGAADFPVHCTGLLLPFTRFTIRRAVRDCAAWQGALPGVAVSVNLSAGALVEPAVIDTLEVAITEAGIGPEVVDGLEPLCPARLAARLAAAPRRGTSPLQEAAR